MGCGPRGREHAEALAQVEGVELVGVADPDGSRRAALAADGGVPGHASLDQLLERVLPDLLVLATPPQGRAELVERAASAGMRAVVVEKPFALSLAEADRMVSACDQANTLLAVCHQLRFVPAFAELARAVHEGEVGEPRLVHASGFGNLLDQGPHLIDAVRWMAGEADVRWAMAQRGDAAAAGLPADRLPPTNGSHPAPAWMTSHLALDGGLRAVVETGALYQRGSRFSDDWLAKRVTVTGSEGYAEASAVGGGRLVSSAGSREWDGGMDDYVDATRAFHERMVEALGGAGRHPCEGRAALATLEAVLACAQSAVDGDAAVLSLDRGRDPVAELANGEVSPRAAGAARPLRPAPAMSVILPLPGHRGYARDCVRSWLEQTLPGDRYELIVLGDGSERGLESEIQSLLRASDRLIVEPGAHETRLYDLGARSASGHVLVFSEPHCLAEPRALDEVARFMSGTDYDGGCLRSVGLSETAVARMEERYFDDSFREWSREGHWCKVILRGFVIRREAYEAVGGFDERYGRFAEFALGASLHAGGHRLGYAAAAAVRHANARSLGESTPPIVDFAQGEALYRREHDPAFCERYFGPAPEAGERQSLDVGAARAACGVAFRNLARRSVWREPAALRASRAALARHAPAAVLGPGPRLARARAEVGASYARVHLSRFGGKRMLDAFADSWQRRGALARLRVEAEQAGQLPPLAPARQYELAELPEQRLLGFHPPEHLDGRRFRWSRGLAAIDVPLADAPRRILLRTAAARPGRAPLCQWVFLDGRRVPAKAVELTPDGVVVDLERVRLRPSGETRITFTCAPLAGEWQPPDRRELGLPLVAVELQD